MKKILVLSDIHIPTRLINFPYEVINPYIKKIDCIFGLGDFVNQKALDILYGFGKEVFCVSGNMDDSQIKSILTPKLTLQVENVNIGLIHGWGGHWGMRDKIRKEFVKINLICYGHTHTAFFGEENGIYFFNPGSISGSKPSFGILSINNEIIKCKIINF